MATLTGGGRNGFLSQSTARAGRAVNECEAEEMDMHNWITSFLIAIASLTAITTAEATPFDPQTLIIDFNVITSGNFATTGDVQGNVLVKQPQGLGLGRLPRAAPQAGRILAPPVLP
jgi:hypothetical protein